MINYFNFRKFNDKYLITNDAGKYLFIGSDTLKGLVQGNIDYNNTDYAALKENFFVSDEHPEVFINKIVTSIQGNKNYLFSGTCLHIFVVTNICNANCIYCQARDREDNQSGMMDLETARRAVDVALQSPEKFLSFEFQGGEPLLNFSAIKEIVEYSNMKKGDKVIEYNVVTNLTLMTDEILDFFIENNVNIATSIDGNEELHNKNRPMKDGSNAYRLVSSKMDEIRQKYCISAIETTTRYSLNHYRELVDTYVLLGMKSIFIRPLTRLGFANAHWNSIGYDADEFVEFYKKSLNYIIDLNQQGVHITEGHALIFLNKILVGYASNYMELRSPCGASIGQMAYYYDGNVYTCDEGRMLAEMGNDMFKIGNVYYDDYNDMMNSNACKATCAASITECVPGCCECAYQPYCGNCPIINSVENGDLYSKEAQNFRCEVYKGILDTLFEIIYEKGDRFDVIQTWIKGESL
jgi:His-Xaa-Ser system radical SAM maturase HxsB